MAKMYRARRTIMIRFENDSIDESEGMKDVIQEGKTLLRMRVSERARERAGGRAGGGGMEWGLVVVREGFGLQRTEVLVCFVMFFFFFFLRPWTDRSDSVGAGGSFEGPGEWLVDGWTNGREGGAGRSGDRASWSLTACCSCNTLALKRVAGGEHGTRRIAGRADFNLQASGDGDERSGMG